MGRGAAAGRSGQHSKAASSPLPHVPGSVWGLLFRAATILVASVALEQEARGRGYQLRWPDQGPAGPEWTEERLCEAAAPCPSSAEGASGWVSGTSVRMAMTRASQGADPQPQPETAAVLLDTCVADVTWPWHRGDDIEEASWGSAWAELCRRSPFAGSRPSNSLVPREDRVTPGHAP